MEILAFIGVLVALAFIGQILSAGAKTIGAAGKAAIGKGTFSENMGLAFKGMGELEAEMRDAKLNLDGTGPTIKEIVVKGLFPIERNVNLGFRISVFDNTEDELFPLLSVIDTFQEDGSVVFQSKSQIGSVSPNQGFISWTRIGVVIPEIMEAPFSGTRKLMVVARMVNLDATPSIHHGFDSTNSDFVLWAKKIYFNWEFSDKGYLEASQHRDEAIGLTLKIGMAVAMADGSLDDEEGIVLKKWIVKSIEPFTEEKQDELKELYNNAMKESYLAAQNGSLSLSPLVERMNEIGEKTTKYETIELCFEIMAADGVADQSELDVIKLIARTLDLDMDEVSKIRDQKIIGLSTEMENQASIEAILGIEPDWTDAQIKKFLRTEFQKWNNRLNSLDEGEERQNAQLMLDRIAEARKKYAS